jgi:methylenetetrahydrofolate dehydrogenase (NADP+)/methenyltetrahydrofolate cyclohydrolase
MAALILDGNAVAQKIREGLRAEVDQLRVRGVTPGLAVILAGEDPASQVYVRNKAKATEGVGIVSSVHRLPASTSEEEVLSLIRRLNADPAVHGILVQLPLPPQIRKGRVLESLDPAKDVDGFHPANMGRLLAGNPAFIPCTPLGVMTLLGHYGIHVEGKRAVVVGRSMLVGKPLAMLLLAAHATVTLAHSKTADLQAVCREAEILVAAVGKPRLITADMVRKGAVVVDVGITRLPDGKLIGDVDFEAVRKKASAISPVPGGVGPMTVAMLLHNTVHAAKHAALTEHGK